MSKLNLYELEVEILKYTPEGARPCMKRFMFIGARNVSNAFRKALRRLNTGHKGTKPLLLKLTGKYTSKGRVFI